MASSRRIPTNENVSTYDSAGGKDYSTLAGWEEATDIDLVSATQGETLECYKGAHADNETFDGATVSSSYWRCIRPASGEGHSGIGKSDGTVVEFHYSGGNMLIASEDNFQFQDLVGKITPNSTSQHYCFYINNNDNAVIGCICYNSANAGSGKANGIFMNDDPVFVINCLIYDLDYGIRTRTSGIQRVYNTTIIDNDSVGINVSTGATVYAKNLLSESGTYGSMNRQRTWEYLTRFENYANDDFRLDDYGMGARWRGIDLSSDSDYAFDDDILGVSRGADHWDIGCFENTTATYSSRRKGVNESISTYDSAGGKDYSDLGTWESATDVDLDAVELSYVIECYKGYHNDHCSMDGASGDDGYNRIIRSAAGEGHSGLAKTDGTVVAFHYDGSSTFTCADIFHSVQDLVVTNTDASTGINCCVNSYNDWGSFVGCIAFGGNNSNGKGFGTAGNNANKQHYFCNCLAYEVPGDCFVSSVEPYALISCTCDSAGDDGMLAYVSGEDHAYNCCSSNGTSDDWGGTWDDKLYSTAEGANPTYTDAANDDYSLAAADTVCRGNGGGVVNNEFWPCSDDIKGNTRSAWDIGAFEYEAESTGIVILRRRMEGN